MSDTTHLIGLLLGTEEDWPTAFESIVRRLGPRPVEDRSGEAGAGLGDGLDHQRQRDDGT